MKHTLKSITDLYQQTFYLEETSSIALVAAVLIASKLRTPPIWLYIIGPSSGGKSALIEAFGKVPFTTQVSDLTPNTFLSGMTAKKGETSLLKRLGLNFTILMKDFTTILNKPEESQAAIIAQMREIYDGHYTKETGNGQTIEWGSKYSAGKGHATFIMASTEAIYYIQDKFSDMGTRATNYVLPPQDRKNTTIRALKNNNKIENSMDTIQTTFCEFIMERLENIPKELPEIDEEYLNEIVDIADFSSMCRSVVKRDYRGVKSLALSAEMPPRIAKQLLSAAQAMIYVNDGVNTQQFKNTVFKLGLDSIPKQRRLILEVLAKYNQTTKTGISDLINYPPDRCEEWLEDLQMFNIVERYVVGTRQYWKIRKQWKDLMIKYFSISPINEDLCGNEESSGQSWTGNYNDPDISHEAIEQRNIIAKRTDDLFDKI